MSNHYSAANLKFPGDDARLDLTDLWVFPAVDAGKSAGGHPTINPFVNPNNAKNTYNLGRPVDDVAQYLAPSRASPGCRTGKSRRGDSSRTPTCCRSSPTWARLTCTRFSERLKGEATVRSTIDFRV